MLYVALRIHSSDTVVITRDGRWKITNLVILFADILSVLAGYPLFLIHAAKNTCYLVLAAKVGHFYR